MSRAHRPSRLPLASRQGVRLVLDDRGAQDGEPGGSQGRPHHHLRFGAPVTPLHDAPQQNGEGSRTAAQDAPQFRPVSAPRVLVPPVVYPPLPPAGSLFQPYHRPAPKDAAATTMAELKRAHPHLAAQIPDASLWTLLEDEANDEHEMLLNQRQQGNLGPEGIDEVRPPLLESGPSWTAVWDAQGERILLLIAGRGHGNELYLHELSYRPGRGIARIVRSQPILSLPEPVKHVAFNARPGNQPRQTHILLYVQTRQQTSMWRLLGSGADAHPFTLLNIQNFPHQVQHGLASSSSAKDTARPTASGTDEELSESRTLAASRDQGGCIVNAAWHPVDPNRLLTVDVSGRLGIWVYDPGIRKGILRKVDDSAGSSAARSTARQGGHSLNEEPCCQVQWAQQRQIAFVASRDCLSVVNLDTGYSTPILNLKTGPRLSSILTRPQIVRVLSSHSDTWNQRSNSGYADFYRKHGDPSQSNDSHHGADDANPEHEPSQPELLAVLTTVDLFVWDMTTLERYLKQDERAAALPSRSDTQQPTSKSRFRPPLPATWWEHGRGQDRTLTLSWIPHSQRSTKHRSLVMSSARSRLMVVYNVEFSDVSASSSPPKGVHATPEGAQCDMTFGADALPIVVPMPLCILESGLPSPSAFDAAKPRGPRPLPRSENGPLFICFDEPRTDKIAKVSRTRKSKWDSMHEFLIRRTQMLLLEQDSRLGVVGTIIGTEAASAPSDTSRLMLRLAESSDGQGEERLAQRYGHRQALEQDEQRDRSIADLRMLYQVLIQQQGTSMRGGLPNAVDVLIKARTEIAAGDLLDAVLYTPQSYLNTAQHSLEPELCVLKHTSSSMSGTMAIAAARLLGNEQATWAFQDFLLALSRDVYAIQLFDASSTALGRSVYAIPDNTLNDLSLDHIVKLGRRIAKVYLGAVGDDGTLSSSVAKSAADVALDLSLSCFAVSSRQVPIVLHYKQHKSADEAVAPSSFEEHDDEQQTAPYGLEEVLQRIIDHSSSWQDDASEDEMGGASQRRYRASSVTPSQASLTSSRLGDLEDEIDSRLDQVEEDHLPKITLPFFSPHQRSHPDDRTRRQQSNSSGPAFSSTPAFAKQPTMSRAARLLLADWTIGETADISKHRNPYETVSSTAGMRDDHLRRSRTPSRSASAQPSRAGTVTPRAHTPLSSNPVERWRTSIAAGAASPSPGLGYGSNGYPPPFSGSSQGAAVVAPGAPRILPCRQPPATPAAAWQGFPSQTPTSPRVSSSQNNVSAWVPGAASSASQTHAFASNPPPWSTLGNSQSTQDSALPATQPLPGRYAERRDGGMSGAKKSIKKKRAGGF